MLPWFELVQLIKAKYDVLDEDAWNFDEPGFLMGKTTSQLVVTGSDKPGKAKKLQPNDREWTTLIQKPIRIIPRNYSPGGHGCAILLRAN
jgi:hypothetical protein